MAKTKKAKGVHYVDNKEFLRAMVEFKEKCKLLKRMKKTNHQYQITLVSAFLK